MAVPEDFQPLDPSPFTELIGPVYMRAGDSAPVLGVRIAGEHANRRGRAHGGLLMTLADIATTLQLVSDQFADMGHKVAYDGPAHAMATVRPDDLHRSVTNLVENAVRFGAEATIRLRMSSDTATIDIEDDGPGISDARKGFMLEPFVRGDDARNMDEAAGFGLGLSIAHAIVLAHGGELSLNDRQPHGLMVRIRLPVCQQSRQAA